MTERVQRMLEKLKITKFPLCTGKMAIAFESFQNSEGEPMVVRRAKILADTLDKIPLYIQEDDLICGEAASRPMGIEMDYENGVWSKEEVEDLKQDRYTISPEDEEVLYRITDEYGKKKDNKTNVGLEGEIFGTVPRLWSFMKSGAITPPWKDPKLGSGGGYAQSGLGLGPGAYLMCVDYERIINEGARSIINEAKECLSKHEFHTGDSIEKKYYWDAIIIAFEAWIRFANRYADLAEKMAADAKDAKRAEELRMMAKICRRVPEYPATSFREALQAFWFTFVITVPSPSNSAGRFDQYMYPFFKKDIENGSITAEEVLELLEIIRIKDFGINRVSGKVNREKNAGMAKWHNFTLGGVDKEGNDVTNELSYLLMDAARETKIPHHTITLRVHQNTPIEAIVKGLETVKSGVAMPAFVGDPSYISFFTNHGNTLEDARNYCMAGCIDGAIPAVTRTQAIYFMQIAHIMDIYMHRGYSKFSKEVCGIDYGDVTQMETFEEFLSGFYKELNYMLRCGGERCTVGTLAMQDLFPDPIRSALMRDGVKSGEDLLKRHIKPFDNISALGAVGVVNTGNAMAAIKTLVYEHKKYTMQQLLDALDADWNGYEEMRQDFLNAPKYGNNDDLPDNLVRDIYAAFVADVEAIDGPTGSKMIANAISISAHQPGGKMTAATADGRKAGEVLADAALSPAQGTDKSGPLAVLQSAMKVNQDDMQGALFNMKFHPSALRTHEDLEKLANAIKTYLVQGGGKHVQFNIVSREQLQEALDEPDKHSDLIVRVAGYSAYFTVLTPMIQKEVYDRTAFEEIS